MSLRLRFVIGMCVIFIAALAWMLHEIRRSARPRYKEAVEESLVDMANTLAAAVSVQTENRRVEFDLVERLFKELRSRPVNAKIFDVAKTDFKIDVYVTDAQGIVLYDSSDPANIGRDFSKWNDVFLTLKGEYGARSTRSDPADSSSSTLFVGAPIRAKNGEILGSVTVSKPTRAMEIYVQKAMWQILRSGYIAGFAMIIAGILFALAITRPIDRLVEYAQRNRGGERFPLPRFSLPEFKRLGEAFEEMRIALEGRREIEKYVQALTHEIKSPLTAIRGAAELLDEQMPSEQRERFLSNIRSESERIQDIVDRLLELAALEARPSLENIESIEVVNVVEEVCESLRSSALSRGVRLEIEPASSQTQLRGERFLIGQSIRNLVQNAIEFSPDQGLVRIELRSEDAKYLEITVTDQGPGIPEYALSRVFERFYSLSRPITGKKSSGLGLSFVKETALLHRGTIVLTNRQGESGAQAALRLPI